MWEVPELKFEDMAAFVMVAHLGSFSRAAVELSIAQSALSKRVRRLEEKVGIPLLERRARGVVLTEAGKAFLERARQIMDDVASLERNLSSLVLTPTGEVRVAMTQRMCYLAAPRLIERCKAELPLIDLKILEGTLTDVQSFILSGEADLALCYSPEFGPEYLVQPIFTEPLFLIAPYDTSALAVQPPEACELADLAQLPLIMPKRPNYVRVLIDRLCAGHGIRPNVIHETDGTYTIRGMVKHGMGYTIFTSNAWFSSFAAKRLRRVPFRSPLVSWQMCMVRPHRSISSVAINRVKALIEDQILEMLDANTWPHARRRWARYAGNALSHQLHQGEGSG